MWEVEFDPSMLCEQRIIVHCPGEESAPELMKVLEECGVVWRNGEHPTIKTRWDDHRSGTCYWIERGKLAYGNKESADSDDDYLEHIKCTFCGVDTSDFDVATDDELLSFIGAR